MKRLLITGAAGSAGAALVAKLSPDYEVVGTRRAAPLTHQLDVTDPRSWSQLMAHYADGLDGLIHTVGDFLHEPLDACEPEQWRAVMASNLDSSFYAYRFAKEALRARRGRLIYFSLAGVSSARAEPNLAAYAAAKSGLQSLVASIAQSEAAHGLTCNTIAPGLLHDASQAQVERYRLPMNRTANPDELVAAVRFLMSDQAEQITGTSIPLSGGWRV